MIPEKHETRVPMIVSIVLKIHEQQLPMRPKTKPQNVVYRAPRIVPTELRQKTTMDSTELIPHTNSALVISITSAQASAAAQDAHASMVLTHIEDRVPQVLVIIEIRVPRALNIIEARMPQKLRVPAITVPQRPKTDTQRSCTAVSAVSMNSHMMSNSARGTKLAHQPQQPDNRDFSVLHTLTTRDSAMPRHDAKMPPSAPQSPPVGREKQRVVQKFIGVSIMKLHIPP